MIIQETIQPEIDGGWILVKTYSDDGKMIRQDGSDVLYEVAIDPKSANRSYVETDIPIDYYETDADKAEAFDILIATVEENSSAIETYK